MAAVYGLLGLFTLGLAAHGVKTGTLQIKGGIARARFPKSFWFCVVCLTATGLTIVWSAGYDLLR